MTMPNTWGYVRVSSIDQNVERQLIAMHAAGVDDHHIFTDKQSGKDFDRPAYKKMLRSVRPGDTIIFKSIDRLGRNYDEIIEEWRYLTKKRRVYIVVLDMPLLDTRKDKDLTGTLIADIVLQLLSYVAQTEREFNHQRQAEGIAAAKARGVHFGRLPKERPAEFETVCHNWEDGKISARAAGRALNVSHTTFMRWAKEVQNA